MAPLAFNIISDAAMGIDMKIKLADGDMLFIVKNTIFATYSF